MKTFVKQLAALGLALSLPLLASPARADGLATGPAALPPAARASLARDIVAEQRARPELFRAVLAVRGVRPEVYKSFRNPKPNAAPELRAFGASGLFPMLSALAFDAETPDLEANERAALTAGMVEAVGLLRDARSAPVLAAVFEGSADPAVQRAAAEGLGRLGSDGDLALLAKHTAAADPRRAAAVLGLGQCKRPEAAQKLASLLAAAPDDASAELVAGALGAVGSSWAWKAMGPSAEAAGLVTREIAARALTDAFPRRAGAARERIGKSILLLEHPLLPELLGRARAVAAPEAHPALDALRKQVEKQLAR